MNRYLAATLGAVVVVGSTLIASVGMSAGTSASATVTNGGETVSVSNPFPVNVEEYTSSSPSPTGQTSNAFGPAPNQGVITGSGYTAGQTIYLQVCDGTSSTSAGYSVAAHCTGGNAGTPVASNGTFSINTGQVSFQFEIFHGEDPNDDKFNCLVPGDDPTGQTNVNPSTGFGTTAVGNQPIDPGLASWGASTANTNLPPLQAGGTAPCQLRIGISQSYTTGDIYVPLTNLDGQPATGVPGAPGTPTVSLGTPGTGDASVTFSPASGTPSSYTATATDTTHASGTKSVTGTSTTLSFTGLTVNDSYTFSVTATNSVGTGPASGSSAATTIPPATIPGAPGTPTVQPGPAGSGSASVTIPPPTTGTAPTSYTVTATDQTNSSATAVTSSGPSSPVAVTGLTSGDSYTFTATATNPAGTGPTSAPSASTLIPASQLPNAPSITSVTDGPDGSGTLTVNLSPGTGPAATGYAVSATDLGPSGSGTVHATSTSTSVIVNGLTIGDNYSFTATASNAQGSSTPSAGYGPVAVPALGAPGAPTVNGVAPGSAGSGSAVVAFTPSGSGDAATGYQISAFDQFNPADDVTTTVPTSPATVNGLTPGASYVFSVVATNAAGSSTSSFWSQTVVVPGGPANGAPSVVAHPTPAGAGTRYAYQVVLGGSPIPYVTLVGRLPRGLSLSASGLISGRTTKAGTYHFTIEAFSGSGSAASTVTLRVLAASAYRIRILSGNHQVAPLGTPFAALRVEVLDRYGNPVSGATVVYRVVVGAPRFRASAVARVRTGVRGISASPRAVSGAPGADAVTAGVRGVRHSATFFLTTS